jgi:flagellar biosynthesis GTPase FlhF
LPIPPGDDAWEAAQATRRAEAAGSQVDYAATARAFGVAVADMIAAMEQLARAEGKAAGEAERLAARTHYARTPEGRERMQEAAGYRGQLAEARRAATEPMGPPRALFRERERVEARQARAAEREDREAVSARRSAARIAEQVESRAAREAEREDREAASARRSAARIGEQEEARAARDKQREARESVAVGRSAERIGRQEEAQAARRAAREEQERSEAVWGRLGPAGGVASLAALARSGLLGKSGSAVAGGAAGIVGGVAMGGVPGAIMAATAAARGMVAFQEAQTELAGVANPAAAATSEQSQRAADIAAGSGGFTEALATSAALKGQALARYRRGEQGYLETLYTEPVYLAKRLFGMENPEPGWFQREPGFEKLGLRGGPVRSGEEIMQEATAASMTGGTLAAENTQRQLENIYKSMEKQGGLLTEVRDTGIESVAMKWRR